MQKWQASAAWLEEMLADGMAEGFQRDDFCAEPLDDHIARLCQEMGLSEEAALNWRDLPDPDEDEDADPRTDAPPPTATTPAPPPLSSA